MNIQLLSIVVPCFNEQDNVLKLTQELNAVLKLYSFSKEFIFVDDGSKDHTYERIVEISKKNSHVKGYALSRNFGHQIALFAGLKYAKGDVVITMDADLQHPPEVIPELLEKYLEGYAIVNTRRVYDTSASWFKKASSKWFYVLINKLSDIRIEPQSSDFRLMNSDCVAAFLNIKEQNRFTRGLVQWIGFKQTIIDYTANKRFSGASGYSLKKMITLAVDGVTSMTSKPLRASLYAGVFFLVVGVIYGGFVLHNFFNGANVPGWTSILILMLLIGGIQLLILSIIAEYLAKIFNEAKARPLYFIKAKTSKDED